MKLHELRSPEGARTRKKRVGRGTGSGHGKTSGRGQKGQLARSQGFRLGFEGGQMPLAQRLPKLGGFRNPFKKHYAVVNLSKLSRFKDGDDITPELLYTEGLADEGAEIKILGAGKLNRKLSVTAHAVSESARRAIEAKGGSVTLLNVPKAPPPTSVEVDTSPADAGEEADAAQSPDTE
jgi:large subunit ribosomal protein L15